MRVRHWVMAGFVGLFLSWCISEYEPLNPPKVTAGDKNIAYVHFPHEWTKGKTTLLRLLAMDSYEIREGPKGTPNELLFAMRSHEDGSYSDDYYKVGLDGQFRVASCPSEEWKRAKTLERTDRRVLYSNDHFNTSPTVQVRGKNFIKTGHYWGVAIPSPTENWLALVSYSSRRKPRNWVPSPFATRQPTRGRIFLEIYETSSGVRSLAAEASYDDEAPATLYGDAFWAGERYFVLPLDHLAKTCFLAIVPEH